MYVTSNTNKLNLSATTDVGNIKKGLSVLVSIDGEIALTYISSVFHRSVAFASRRACSHCVGDVSCYGGPPAPLGCSPVPDSFLGARRYEASPPASLWISS